MKKKKLSLYEQDLNSQDIFLYIPPTLKIKLSSKDRKLIREAFYLTVLDYQKRYEEKYLNKMLI